MPRTDHQHQKVHPCELCICGGNGRNPNLTLEAKEVEKWISSDEISVVVEADVFKIVLKWIEQNKSERKEKKKILIV